MKTIRFTVFAFAGFCLPVLLPAADVIRAVAPAPAFGLEPWLETAEVEYRTLADAYTFQAVPVLERLEQIRVRLSTGRTVAPSVAVNLMLEYRQMEDSLQKLNEAYAIKVVRLRYRKSIEIVKMLYEKILSMDHHFSSMLVQHEFSNLSNPHQYPVFDEARTEMLGKVERRYGFVLPELLSNNPFLSASFSIVGLMLAGGDSQSKKRSMDALACVLDFTVRMHADLNTIHFETGYLRDANLSLKRDCELLFADCTRILGYTTSLEKCRNNDDWEHLFALLDTSVEESLTPEALMPPALQKSTRLLNNLQFAVDRVVQFINRYSDFVNAGAEYYRKFDQITSSYPAEAECRDVLSDPFEKLRSDIGQMLEKFDSAYRMPEMQGSKLKELLYGLPD